MTNWPTARIHGQESFLLTTRSVELALTAAGGMLGPVTFFPQDRIPIRPYAVAPWAQEQWRYRRPILLAVALAMFNQLIGINAVLYYLNDIFAMAGFDRTSQNLQAVAVGAVMLIATLVALSVIDRFGRRTLLLVGSVGLGVCLAGIVAIFHLRQFEHFLLALVVGYVGFFAFSQGAVIWVYLSEIFPSRVRAQGQSLGSSTHWIMNALLSAAFPLLAAQSQARPFVLFFVMVVLQFFVVLLFFPETRGVTLEEIQHRMGVTRAGSAEGQRLAAKQLTSVNE